MVNIEIDGKQIEAEEGAMVIEAADAAGITIPRFCYHKKLSVAANCRMCLVEVEKAAKPLPACATPVTEGMKVFTRSKKAIAAQKSVMEFLLINHPLDCPICDQGGECDLQDLAVGYGADRSHFGEGKRVVKDKNIGPLIATDMTRCIHCTRCVRFGQEVAGLPELGATGRGEHMEIGTYVAKAMVSEMSGNVIDLCPVGSLTSKPFRFHARSWELTVRPAVAAHDCAGSNINVESLRGTVRRVTPRENESINEVWLSDRDRFSYEGLNHEERLTVPMVKRDGKWQETDWQSALEATVDGLKAVLEKHGAGQLGALASPNSTLEEFYLLQKLVRGLGSANIDHRLRQSDFSDQDAAPLMPGLGCSIEELERLNAALLIGSNIRLEQPILNHRLRKAAMMGGQVMFINAVDYDFNYPVAHEIVTSPAGMERALAGVARALADQGAGELPEEIARAVAGVEVDETHKAMAEALKGAGGNAIVLIGSGALAHPAAANLRALARAVATLSGARIGTLSEGANSAGGWLAGALPHRGAGARGGSFGLTARGMLEEKLPAYLLMGIEPELDCGDAAMAMEAIKGADFVVNLTPYVSEAMREYADVLLPIAPFSETSGTFVNCEGRWQSFGGSVKPLGETRPGWKVLRVLGNLFALDGFDYVSSDEVRDELKKQVESARFTEPAPHAIEALSPEGEGAVRLADVPIYSADPVVRRAASLQDTVHVGRAVARVNSAMAQALGLEGAERVVASQGGRQRVVALEIDDRVADGCVLLPAAVAGTSGFGGHGQAIELKRA